VQHCLEISGKLLHSEFSAVQHAIHDLTRDLGILQGADDRLRALLASTSVDGVVELGEELAVFVWIEEVLTGIRVWSVELALLDD
jgi:hypothetical protein